MVGGKEYSPKKKKTLNLIQSIDFRSKVLEMNCKKNLLEKKEIYVLIWR